jgi:anaerobic ribonucleoside-triphosphate reductase
MRNPQAYDPCPTCGEPKKREAQTCRRCYVWAAQQRPLRVFACPRCHRKIVKTAGRACPSCSNLANWTRRRAQAADQASVGIFQHE